MRETNDGQAYRGPHERSGRFTRRTTRGRALAFIAAACIASGCGASPALDPRAPEPVQRVEPVEARGAPRALLRDLSLESGAVLPEEDGVRPVVLGNLRVAIGAESIAIAEQRFARDVVLAERCGSGWVFVADDGLVAYGEAFLADTRSIGVVPERAAIDVRSSEGTIAFVDGDGVIRTGPCGGPLRAVEVPAEPVVDLRMSGLRGEAILFGGRLASTRDGGETWEFRSFGHEAAYALNATGADVEVRTHGALVEPAPLDLEVQMPAGVSMLSKADRDRVIEALWREDSAGLRVQLGSRGHLVVLDDGAVVVLVGRDVVRLREGRAEHTEDALPDGCQLFRFNDGVAAHCLQFTERSFHSTDGLEFSPLDLPPMRGVSFADDGRHLGGECMHSARDYGPVCLVDASSGERFETSWPEGPRSWGWFGDRGLFSSHGHPSALFVLDGRRSAIERMEARDLDLAFAGWTVDGWVYGVGVRSGTDSQVLALFGPGHRLVSARPLPAGAVRARMLDRYRGLAIGESAGLLWTTRDGGARWTPIAIPMEGAPEGVPTWPHMDEYDRGMRSHCGDNSCAIGRVVIEWADAPPPVRWIAAEHIDREPPSPAEVETVFNPNPRDLGRFSCEPTGNPVALPALPYVPLRDLYHDIGRARRHAFVASGVQLDLTRANGRATASWSYPWGSEVREGRVGFPVRQDERFSMAPILHTPAGVLLAVCGSWGLQTICAELWATPRGAVRLRSYDSTFSSGQLVDYVPLADGGALFAFATRESELGIAVASPRPSGPASTVAIHNFFRGRQRGATRLARTPEGPAILATYEGGRQAWLFPVLPSGLGVPRAITPPVIEPGPIPPCTASDEPSLTLRVDGEWIRHVGLSSAFVELRPSSTCIRSIAPAFTASDESAFLTQYTLEAVDGSTLRGFSSTRDGFEEVVCTREEEP